MKKLVKDYLFLAIIAAVIVILDQYTKTLVRDTIPVGGFWSPWDWLTPIARIVHINNTGVAFGMFQGQNLLFSILAMIVSVAIIYYFPRVPSSEWIVRLALAMMLAGAVGNLIDRVTQPYTVSNFFDRIRQGYVTDFISVGNFAIFNIADSSITVGVGVLLLGVWLQERRRKAAEKAITPPMEPSETHDTTGPGD